MRRAVAAAILAVVAATGAVVTVPVAVRGPGGPRQAAGPPHSPRDRASPAPSYYLSLGDSLARGVQPDRAGASVATSQGYPDQLYAMLRPGDRALRLVKLGARVADVAGAFRTADFTGQASGPAAGPVPRNVALICTWTWACARPPRGPNEHANSAGYRVIARAFHQADLS
jgi:hypothetical protein